MRTVKAGRREYKKTAGFSGAQCYRRSDGFPEKRRLSGEQVKLNNAKAGDDNSSGERSSCGKDATSRAGPFIFIAPDDFNDMSFGGGA